MLIPGSNLVGCVSVLLAIKLWKFDLIQNFPVHGNLEPVGWGVPCYRKPLLFEFKNSKKV